MCVHVCLQMCVKFAFKNKGAFFLLHQQIFEAAQDLFRFALYL